MLNPMGTSLSVLASAGNQLTVLNPTLQLSHIVQNTFVIDIVQILKEQGRLDILLMVDTDRIATRLEKGTIKRTFERQGRIWTLQDYAPELRSEDGHRSLAKLVLKLGHKTPDFIKTQIKKALDPRLTPLSEHQIEELTELLAPGGQMIGPITELSPLYVGPITATRHDMIDDRIFGPMLRAAENYSPVKRAFYMMTFGGTRLLTGYVWNLPTTIQDWVRTESYHPTHDKRNHSKLVRGAYSLLTGACIFALATLEVPYMWTKLTIKGYEPDAE